jgi:hypothetical protein
MFSLLQQICDAELALKLELMQNKNGDGKNLLHTDFEGYRAISSEAINNIPKDMNGLKNAVAP